jgi:hypothetical protein
MLPALFLPKPITKNIAMQYGLLGSYRPAGMPKKDGFVAKI